MRFRAVVIDVDSTLVGLEGIDWLASRRGPELAQEVARLTTRAMEGEIPLEQVYGLRLAMIAPSREDIGALSAAYRNAVAQGAAVAIRRMRDAGVSVTLVSGGIREAILPLARELGLPASAVHAVSVRFDASGAYAGYDARSPLATQGGKESIVRDLALPRPVLAVGDGATDAAMRGAADAFGAFTFFVRRPAVIAAADLDIHSFARLAELVLE
ncbi:MAG TPA: HAD-IB family phosphatase [Gemmatimonadaceae bacterium]